MSNFTGIKYDGDVGFYAVNNGRITCDWSRGVSGSMMSAEMDLARVWDLAEIETQAEENFDRIHRGGAGSPKAHAAHAEWMAARTARAAQDAQDATKASEGHTGIKPALAIDWRNVGPLDEDERINPNEPSYLHIPF